MYKVIKRSGSVFGNEPYTCEFVCDTASDISTLPTSISEGTGGKSAYDNQKCASGSIATVVDNGAESKRYMMNNQNVWCPQLSNTNAIPVASTDVLGGVMVDGTSITANEQGVISALGSGGGLTLMGTYNLETSNLLGSLDDFPRGTRLLFEYAPTSGTSITMGSVYRLISGYVPLKDVTDVIVNCLIPPHTKDGTVYSIRISTSANKVSATTTYSYKTWNVYKWEV